jgi:hypothetical protein
MKMFGRRALEAQEVLSLQDHFWEDATQTELPDLLRYSFFLGLFPFAGYLLAYTIRGTIWSYWPFIQTTLDSGSGLIFSALQWILFATFPLLCALLLEMATRRSKVPLDLQNCLRVVAYSMTPLCVSALFIGLPFFDRIFGGLGFATFLYLLYYGFRISLRYTISRSGIITLCVLILFAIIRELFVFAIGY